MENLHPPRDGDQNILETLEQAILIGTIDLNNSKPSVKSFYVEDFDSEKEMLQEAVKVILPDNKWDAVLVGYGIAHYDFPMLAERCSMNKIGGPNLLFKLLDRPYLDVENVTKFARLKETNLQSWLGNKDIIFGPKSVGRGGQVRNLFLTGQREKLITYNADELVKLHEWWWKGKSLNAQPSEGSENASAIPG